ncbi:MAG TPA: response regulator transcription factor [Phycisphaerae bacterium]|jgi:DNA-binding response OmpR family regulator|nr:response regulator transcription factor [Phycisphaerae bacterium]
MAMLLVEDDEATQRMLQGVLARAGFEVDAAGTVAEARRAIGARAYDVVVLDVKLPDGNGLELLRELRESGNATHVLILTVADAAEERVRGLDAGADDYLSKSAPHAELEARVRALVRRKYGAKNPRMTVCDLEIDTVSREVVRGGRRIPLTVREFELLALLARFPGQVVSRQQIWKDLYGAEGGNSNVIDVYIGYLRRKIDGAKGRPLIHTRRGIGFMLGEGNGG